MDLKALTAAIAPGRELSTVEVAHAAHTLADETVPAADKEWFLEALSQRGETPAEIAGFARTFRDLARNPGLERWAGNAVDVCGTGGDRSGTFNVSTVVAFVLAAGHIPVIKHGNRSITSSCGSADLLEAVGIKLDADPAQLQRSMNEINFVFLFAPNYHPAFKTIVPVRKALAARGVRTVFNLLGPLLNPARPAFQLMGVPAEPLVGPIAQALHALGLTAGLAVHCRGPQNQAYDELTVVGRNRASGAGKLNGTEFTFEAGGVGLTPGAPADLAGGDKTVNLALLERLVDGQAPAALVDTIVLNAGAALHVCGRANSIRDGLGTAREWLLGGAVRLWLQRAKDFYRA
jgi:anthranilate phosphoribosyltransferase